MQEIYVMFIMYYMNKFENKYPHHCDLMAEWANSLPELN